MREMEGMRLGGRKKEERRNEEGGTTGDKIYRRHRQQLKSIPMR